MFSRPALALILLLGLAGPAHAAPAVTRGAPLTLYPYEKAAAAVGETGWGDAARSENLCHVLARVERSRMAFMVALPPDVPQDRAQQWLRSLADRLGWTDVRLYINPAPGALYLRAGNRTSVRRRGLGSRFRLDLETLRQELARITDKPAILCIRTPGAEIFTTTPPPDHAGTYDGDGFAFYRLSARMPPTLVVDYGLPPRWVMALLLASFFWAVFPLVPLMYSREIVARQSSLTPLQQEEAFGRWLRGIRLACAAGVFATFLMLGLGRIAAYAPPLRVPEVAPAFVMWFWCGGVAASLRQPWQRDQRGPVARWLPLLGALAFSGFVIVGPLLLFRLGTAVGQESGLRYLNAGAGLLLAAFGAGAILRMRWVRRGGSGAQPEQ